VKTIGLKPFVVDDVPTRAPVVSEGFVALAWTSLEGRERLDERLARWEAERARFEKSRGVRPPESSAPHEVSADGGA
jgi:hypothetical protein